MTTVAVIAEAFCKIASESIVENYYYFFSECYIVFQRTEMTSTERTMGHPLISTCIVQTSTEKTRLSERVFTFLTVCSLRGSCQGPTHSR